ncbi:MAG: tRNA (N6-threonylcarbamoyladenosine(37)-N6)-methyltransferase TrmO [Clostridia bacterium]|nr:tRNA (N6-threonylcarbamoyladenosine(37)-N6)-methyltransferase TrmO [Clostridia bacterium]
MQIIARVRNDFPTKFGLPRQSGLVQAVESRVVFEPEYRVPEALRGIEDFSHLWLVWGFHEAKRAGGNEGGWQPTVRPPRLGGNMRLGVFATRSPFRPNPIGLSCVKLVRVEDDPREGRVLVISGADMMDGTPVYDVKPYLPYADCHPEATGGFTDQTQKRQVSVEIPPEWLAVIPKDKLEALRGVLQQDPRPAYHHDPERVYGFGFAGMEIRFRVQEGVLTVCEVTKA